MTIRCPRCGRTGDVPDQLESTPHTVRCRKCLTRFSPVSLPDLEGFSRLRPRRDGRPGERAASGLALMPFLPLLTTAREEENHSSDDEDSQYELPVMIDDGDDSQDGPRAGEAGRCLSSDDFPVYTDNRPSGEFAVRPGAEIAVANLWYLRFIDSWARYHFVIALGFGALSLVILGFSLARAVVGAQTVSLSVTALITGGIALVAFSLLLVTATALNLVLVSLARNVRRLRIPHDRDRRIASD
jgi:hypothetical protein